MANIMGICESMTTATMVRNSDVVSEVMFFIFPRKCGRTILEGTILYMTAPAARKEGLMRKKHAWQSNVQTHKFRH
jgi:hypothetical protein